MLPRKHTYVIISDHIKTVRQAQVERISYIQTISQPITDLIDYNSTLPCRDMGQRLSDPVPEVSHREKPKETQEHKDKPKEKRIPQALTFLQLFTLLSCVKVKKTPFDPSQSGDGRKGTTINDTNNNNDSDTGEC